MRVRKSLFSNDLHTLRSDWPELARPLRYWYIAVSLGFGPDGLGFPAPGATLALWRVFPPLPRTNSSANLRTNLADPSDTMEPKRRAIPTFCGVSVGSVRETGVRYRHRATRAVAKHSPANRAVISRTILNLSYPPADAVVPIPPGPTALCIFLAKCRLPALSVRPETRFLAF
jgi:hypothetical protein